MADGFSSDSAEKMVNRALAAAAREQSGTGLTDDDMSSCCPERIASADFTGENDEESSCECCS